MDRPKSRLAPALIVAAILCAVLVAYIAGYFTFSDLSEVPGMRLRTFNAEWQAFMYAPAAWLESMITGEPVYSSLHVSTSQATEIRAVTQRDFWPRA